MGLPTFKVYLMKAPSFTGRTGVNLSDIAFSVVPLTIVGFLQPRTPPFIFPLGYANKFKRLEVMIYTEPNRVLDLSKSNWCLPRHIIRITVAVATLYKGNKLYTEMVI